MNKFTSHLFLTKKLQILYKMNPTHKYSIIQKVMTANIPIYNSKNNRLISSFTTPLRSPQSQTQNQASDDSSNSNIKNTTNGDNSDSSSFKLNPPSIAPEGTIFTGLHIYDKGTAPVAMRDSEYPPWLWEILDGEAQKRKQDADPVKKARYNRRQANRTAIKQHNFEKKN